MGILNFNIDKVKAAIIEDNLEDKLYCSQCLSAHDLWNAVKTKNIITNEIMLADLEKSYTCDASDCKLPGRLILPDKTAQ